ncbi:MAG: dethiobiotin synthase [Verrucomicrobiales bacterium]
MKGGLFITGTDTNVGKTWVTVRLIEALRERGVDAVGMKPIESGGTKDSEALLAASSRDDLDLRDVNPINLSEPVAPAASRDGVTIDFDQLCEAYENLAAKSELVFIEGAGGWVVPVDETRTMVDLAVQLGQPVLIVAANRLGVMNHTLLTLTAVRAAGLECMGVLLNTFGESGEDVSCETNAEVLRQHLGEVPLFEGFEEAIVSLSS